MAPYFPSPQPEFSEQLVAMPARELPAPRVAADSTISATATNAAVQVDPAEVAFLASQDQHSDPRPDSRPFRNSRPYFRHHNDRPRFDQPALNASHCCDPKPLSPP